MQINYCDEITIPENSIVKIEKMGKTVELTYSENGIKDFPVKRISKEYYINKNGEKIKFKHNTQNHKTPSNIKRSLKKCRSIINTNFDSDHTLFFTLTYKDLITDPKTVKYDVYLFLKRMHYRYKWIDKSLYIIEPQLSGGWHIHLLMTSKKPFPYIPNNDIEKIWGKGFTSTKAIHSNIKDIGMYLTCYLTDIELSEMPETIKLDEAVIVEKEVMHSSGEMVKKSFIKGARIPLYPHGLRIYGISGNIEKPTIIYIQYGEANILLSNYVMTFSNNIKVSDNMRNYANHIRHEYYTLNDSVVIKKDDKDCGESMSSEDTINDNAF